MGVPQETENPYTKSHTNGRSWLTTALSPCPVEAYSNPTSSWIPQISLTHYFPFREGTPVPVVYSREVISGPALPAVS